jgi:predicted phosphodiesterase
VSGSARVALLGGIYSNYLALAAVLRQVRRRGADVVWCLGDLGGFGPHPDRSAEILRGAEIPMLRGNYDDSIGNERHDCACGYTDPRDNHFAQLSYEYTRANTAADHRAWMRALPVQQRLEIAGRRVLLCHGSPRQMNEFLWETECPDVFLEWLCDAHRADVIACTHTGIPWHRALPSGRHVINVGAIGRPANDGRTDVAFAALEMDGEVRVEFLPVAYDVERLARDMARESLPQEFIETIRTGWWTTCLENLPSKERRRGRH